MAGLAFDLNVRDAVDAVQSAFEEFGERAFPRAVQFALNRVTIDAVNRFRDDEMPAGLRHMTAFTKAGVRYELDKSRLDSVTSVDGVVSAAFILPMQSVWLKYALGEETRFGGDVGIEGYFPDKSQIYLPVESGLEAVGIRPRGGGTYKGADIKMIGRSLAKGIRVSGGARFGGSFEIKAGDRDPARLGVGIHARPMRGLAVQSREKVRAKVRSGKMASPRTQFVNGRGRQVDVPKVVNLGVPQLMFLTRPEGHYKAPLSPRWEATMQRSADKIGDYLERELVDKMEHAIKRGRR